VSGRAWLAVGVLIVAQVLAACGPVADGRDPYVTAAKPPLLGGTSGVFVDPDGPAAQWVQAHPADPGAEQIRAGIAAKPAARHVSEPVTTVAAAVSGFVDAAAKADRRPVMVLDSDGAGDCQRGAADYRRWFEAVALGIGARSAIVVVQAGTACTTLAGAERGQVLSDAVRALTASPHVTVLLDASKEAAISTQTAVDFLVSASVRETAGVTVNVGRYAGQISLAKMVSALRDSLRTGTGRSDYHIVADGSRNAGSPDGDCNPSGAKVNEPVLGSTPTSAEYLWLTEPGISDGPCGLAPSSRRGEFVPALALSLLGR
jgi:endoglucanase